MVIAGSNTKPSDHYAEPALSVYNLSGSRYDLHPNRTFNTDAVKAWTEQIYTINLKNAPAPFCVFSFNNSRNPQTAPLAITPEFTWHQTTYQMSHFPIDRQPYLTDYDKSIATFPSQVSHSSVIGIEAYDGTDWGSDYQLDTDGRKFRVYISLFGLNTEVDDVSRHATTWLFDGSANVTSPYIYKGVDYKEKTLVFQSTASGRLEVDLSKSVSYPTIKLEGVKLTNPSVKVGGASVVGAIAKVVDNDTYVYIPQTIDSGKKILVE